MERLEEYWRKTAGGVGTVGKDVTQELDELKEEASDVYNNIVDGLAENWREILGVFFCCSVHADDHSGPLDSCIEKEELKIKGSRQNRKKKKCDNYHTLGLIPPPKSVIIYNLIFLSFWHHKEQLWSKLFFPLEKVKILRKFFQNWSSEGV